MGDEKKHDQAPFQAPTIMKPQEDSMGLHCNVDQDNKKSESSSSQIHIETPRLTIEPFKEKDRPFVVSILQSSLMAYIGKGILTEKEAQIEFDNMLLGNSQGSLNCRISLLSSGLPIGWCKLYAMEARSNYVHLGYLIAFGHQGQGYGTESATAMKDYGFQRLNINRLEAYCRTENIASQRVLEKIGMQLETRSFLFDGRRYCQYAIENNIASDIMAA